MEESNDPLTNSTLNPETGSTIGENDENPVEDSTNSGISNDEALTRININEENLMKIAEEVKAEAILSDSLKELITNPLPLSMIPEGQYPFYGCAVCNISYLQLKELDQHVMMHKDRVTSWDLRVKALEKKRKLKKAKRHKKIKVELEENVERKKVATDDIDIVPDETTTIKVATNDIDIVPNDNSPIKAVDDEAKSDDVGLKTDGEGSLEKIFKCAGCFKQFSLSYYLKLHVRSHTGEKPYQCSECGVAFITASKLGRHRRMHTMAKYECRICHKLFSRFDTLTRHFDKKHLEEKLDGEPYDFNAILPYLKELEEELARKNDTKPEPTEDVKVFKQEDLKTEFVSDIKVEKLTIDVKFEHEEHLSNGFGDDNDSSFDREESSLERDSKYDKDDKSQGENGFGDDSASYFDEPVKDEDTSENEDYFPIDAWTTPNLASPDDSAPTSKTKKKKRRIKPEEITVQPLLPVELEEDPLQCKMCGKHIKTPTYLRIHMRTHTGERPFKCYICQKGFITSSKMHRHVLTHMDESWDESKAERGEKITVKVEPDWDDNPDDNENGTDTKSKPIKRRTRKRNTVPKSYVDSILKKLPSEPKVRRPRIHACDFCNKRFLHQETLQVHRRSHKDEVKPISCHFCLTDFETNDELNLHLVSHTGPSPYVCTLCGKKYKRRETMVYHRKMHKMEKKYQCDVCSKTFIAPCKLQRHLVSHRPNKFVVRYECPVCAHIFNTKYHIEMHLTTHEKDGQILKENRGDILAMVLQNARKIPIESDSPITNLKDLMPSDERSRICNICGEIFHHFYYLEEHLKTHGTKFNLEALNESGRSKLEDAERRYKCEVCQKGFKLHYYLKLHSFTHTKEKPFICQRCGKGFITKGKLKRHLESHAGLKKYQCHICCKFFTRPSYLRIHVKTIHGKAKDGYSISMPLSSTYIGHDENL